MTRRVATPKGAKKECDRLFSLIVRSRGRCENCYTHMNLQCAHILSRRFSNTRCVEANAFALCAGCHHHFTDHPVEFGQFTLLRIGQDAYDELVRLAHSHAKVDWVALKPELAQRLKGLAA